MSVQLIDNAMIGRFGTAELAAASFANNIYIVIMLLGMGVFMGITPLVGRALGSKNDSRVATTLKSGCILSTVLIPTLVFISWSITWAMPYMGQTDEVVRLSIPYFKILVFSLVPLLLFSLLKQIGEGLGNTFVAMAATLVSNIVNVLLNYTLIFGKFGFPELGLLGAGYATFISRLIMFLAIYIGFLYFKPVRYYFHLMRGIKASLDEIKRIARVGFPIATQMVLEISAFAISSIMMGWMGNVPLASHQIAIGLAAFTFMIANGVAMASTIRVSFQLGTRDIKKMGRVCYSAIHLVLVYMGICGILFLILRNQLPYIFTADARVLEQASSLLVVAALFQVFDGLQVVCLGILRGFADVKIPMFIAGISHMIIGLSVSYSCAFIWELGPEGIWYGFVAGLVCAGILLALRISTKMRRIKKIVPL